jgi:hypothetical protein
MSDLTPDVVGEPCKLICAAVLDDGTDLRILEALREEKGVLRANSVSCLSSSVAAESRTKPGKLPQPVMGRLVEILVPEADADEVFEFVCRVAVKGGEDGGAVWQTAAPFCTPYELPEGLPEEGA